MLKARDIMAKDVRVVEPDMRLPDLERAFLDAHVSGFPVVEDGKLVGTVSRSDVIRALCVEQSLSEVVADYYRVHTDIEEDPLESLEDVAERVGTRVDTLTVGDVMIKDLITVPPELAVNEVARTLIDNRVHRVLVTKGGELIGIVSSTDIVRLVADGTI